ncbi:hypothetical protein BV20DRAFT_954018 [Pilatotrama ljubarskyi]|nr:hypothetical protein BV20DRAFT_954018 [Pilatotrama ljubarskyi]
MRPWPHSSPFSKSPKQGLDPRYIHNVVPSLRPDTEVLFSYTSTRWLCNDKDGTSTRYVPFDPDGLERVACKSVRARQCVSWTKIGSFNRVFLLEFDNGTEAAIRIPFPVVGNVGRTIASEVATIMSYIRDRWLNGPLVFAWNSSYDNPVRTPYIILEYSPGVPLGARWLQIQGTDVSPALEGIVTLDRILLQRPFSQHGSLYFADDLPEDLRTRPLYPGDEHTEELDLHLDSKYKIGPTVNREWWRGHYGRVDANRGPWPDMQTMITSAAEFQLRALDLGVVDLASAHVKSAHPDVPLLRRMLELCIHAAPLIVPSDPALTAPVLNHPNLSLPNLVVSEEGPARILHSIDWQGATVSPFCMQADTPPAVAYTGGVIPVPEDGSMPPWPSNFDSMTTEEQEYIRIHHRLACRHRAYSLGALLTDSRYEAWSLPHFASLVKLVPFITRCVAEGPADLQGVLIDLEQKWTSITSDGSIPCPIDFTPEEIAAHAERMECQAEYERNVAQLYRELGCLADGSVETQEYEAAKMRMKRFREEWDETAMKGPFPLCEGAPSYYLS